jgi:glucose/arabinose dehydrogenase
MTPKQAVRCLADLFPQGIALHYYDAMKSSILSLFVLTPLLAAQDEPVKSTITGNIFRPIKLEADDTRIRKLAVAEGYLVSVFARNLGAPRMMACTPDGKVYVTRRGDKGDVLLLEDRDKNGVAEEARTILKMPHVHGIAIKDDMAYLSTVREVYSVPIKVDGSFGEPIKLYDNLPDAGQHPNRTLGFSPDGKLFLSVGSTCNAALEPNAESATILELETNGGSRQIHASGLRNTIGFDWHPQSGKLYGMDHGIDWLGDDAQLEELNEIKPGRKYGWPFVYEEGKANLADDPREPTGMTWEEYAKACEPSVLAITAHSAPMALLFPSGKQFPPTFAGHALVTLHGSWNRGQPSGYSVARLIFEEDRPVKFVDFITGFYIDEERGQFGRPCGLVEWKDGSVLMSDDSGGVIYRIRHSGGLPAQ